jgi:hypothetical protein
MPPLLSAAAPSTLIGMPSCHSLEPQFNGFDIAIMTRGGLHFKSSKDKLDMLPLNFLQTPNETFGASGDDTATQQHRVLPPRLSAYATSTSPEATAKLIVSSLKKYGPQAAKLTGCMIQSELTRQWINKHIKNTTSTSCDGGADVASGIVIPKKKQEGCAKTCPSAQRRASSSKRYFRHRSRSKQLAKKQDLRPAGARRRRLVGSTTTTTAAAEETSKYLAQATSYTKKIKISGDLLKRPNPRKVMVSDYLRMTQRA